MCYLVLGTYVISLRYFVFYDADCCSSDASSKDSITRASLPQEPGQPCQVYLPVKPNNQPGTFMVPLQPNSQTPQLALQGLVPPQCAEMSSYGSSAYFQTQTGQYELPSITPRFGLFVPGFGGNVPPVGSFPAFPEPLITKHLVNPSAVAIPGQLAGLPVSGVPSPVVETVPPNPGQVATGPDFLKQPYRQNNPRTRHPPSDFCCTDQPRPPSVTFSQHHSERRKIRLTITGLFARFKMPSS
ncbi:hypothetical protein GN956_G20672 [Arapaima gigas]